MDLYVDPEVEKRVGALELPFNRYGLDPYGVSRQHLIWFFSPLASFYRKYFRVTVHGIENIPNRGRGLVIGNHSGGLPVDAGMILTSMLLDHTPPRLAHGMVDTFVAAWPVVGQWFSRVGLLTGLPEHAHRLLEDERLVLAFPEGARGTGKLYRDRYNMVRFGTGFMRLALQTRSPIVPFAFIGGEEAIPTIYHARLLAKLTGAPYFPIPLQLVPFPLPVHCEIWYGEVMSFEGSGSESDEVIGEYVEQVKQKVKELITRGLAARGGRPPRQEGQP